MALEASAYPHMTPDDQEQTRGPYLAVLNKYEEQIEADFPDIAAARQAAQESVWAKNRAALAREIARG